MTQIADTNDILDGFYEVLMARIKAVVPGIKHIDVYEEQYDDPEIDDDGNPIALPFRLPAAFIEFPPEIQYQSLGMRRKAAIFPFRVHIVREVIQERSSRTTPVIRAKAYEKNSVVVETEVCLEGFNGNQVVEGYNQFDAISLTGRIPQIKILNTVADILQFRTRLISDKSRKTLKRLDSYVPAKVATDIINTEFSDDLDPETV